MAQLKKVASTLEPPVPQGRRAAFPPAFPERRRRLRSTSPLERLHAEVKRRTHLVGIFPRASLMRHVGALLSEQDDEWQVADRRDFSISSMERIEEIQGGEIQKEPLAAIA